MTETTTTATATTTETDAAPLRKPGRLMLRTGDKITVALKVTGRDSARPIYPDGSTGAYWVSVGRGKTIEPGMILDHVPASTREPHEHDARYEILAPGDVVCKGDLREYRDGRRIPARDLVGTRVSERWRIKILRLKAD